jgi:hypothetical protein
MQEILWMLAPERVHKAIFIVDDQRLGANLNRGLKQAGDESRSEVLACNEKTLYDLLPNMTRSSQDLPAPGKDHWRKKVNETMTALDNLMFLIRAETTTDAALDGAIHVWEQSHPADTGSPSNNIRYSASFDTALALIKRRLPEATVALFVYTSGNAEVEIGVPDRGSDWMVYSSRETPRLVLNPTRATLLAWAKAEQGWRKEPESPADTGTQDEEARWRERSIQIARTDPK